MKDYYEVKTHIPCPGKSVSVTVPGSKSITNRALLLAAMSQGDSVLEGCLTSDDARHFLECLKLLGFEVSEESDGTLGSNIRICGHGGAIPNKQAELYVGSAGTAARFLAAMLAFSDGEYVMNASEQMKRRPMEPLIQTLREAGAEVRCTEREGHFPLFIRGTAGKCPDRLHVNIDQSSQFLSALLIAAGTLSCDVEIYVEGNHGLAYVDMTAQMMEDFGIKTEKMCRKDANQETLCYSLRGTDRYIARSYPIEPDLSAAAYFYALAAVLGCSVEVRGVKEHMLQGDMAFLELLCSMGCELNRDGAKFLLTGPKVLRGGFTADLSAFSDQALTLAAIAPYADGPIEIGGIGHIRLQECDRIHAICENLAHLGIQTEEGEDFVRIFPGELHGGEVETYEDHRVAMSFALTGLRCEGVIIRNPGCCSKTFAQYFDVLEGLLSDLDRKK